MVLKPKAIRNHAYKQQTRSNSSKQGQMILTYYWFEISLQNAYLGCLILSNKLWKTFVLVKLDEQEQTWLKSFDQPPISKSLQQSMALHQFASDCIIAAAAMADVKPVTNNFHFFRMELGQGSGGGGGKAIVLTYYRCKTFSVNLLDGVQKWLFIFQMFDCSGLSVENTESEAKRAVGCLSFSARLLSLEPEGRWFSPWPSWTWGRGLLRNIFFRQVVKSILLSWYKLIVCLGLESRLGC